MTENETTRLANWVWTSVGELGDVSGGITKNASKAHLAIKIPYLRVANVYANELRLDDIAEIGVTQAESVRALLVKGDLLVVEGNGSIDQIGRVALWNGGISPCLHQNHLIKVRFGVTDLGPFVMYWLLSPDGRDRVVRAASSTSGLHTLSLSKVASLPAPIAPLPEQRRIVEAIESYFTRLDDAVATLERVQRNLKRYRASVLQAAVEGRLVPTEAELARAEGRDYEPAPVLLERILAERRRRWQNGGGQGKYHEPVAHQTADLPEGWCWASVDGLLRESLRNGRSARKAVDGDVPTLTLSAVTERNFSETNTKLTAADRQQVRDLWLEPGDIFVERSNTPGLVGTAALYRGPRGFAIFPDLLIRVRPADNVLPLYVETVLRSPRARTFFRQAAQGIAGSMPKISQETVAALAVPLPPLLEQCRIVAELERQLSVADEAEASVSMSQTRCSRLRQSILKWAFEGKLADQDPADEPASALLARIRQEPGGQVARAPAGMPKKRQGRRGTMVGTSTRSEVALP